MRAALGSLVWPLRVRLNRLRGRARVRTATKLSLGDSGRGWGDFATAGLSGEMFLDVTAPLADALVGRYAFIWSERMLEHIRVEDLPAALANVAGLLQDGARCRMCLPLCFWGTDATNMMRAGNRENCVRQGHVTWFTHEGLGPVTEEDMGAADPPPARTTSWDDQLAGTGLAYVPVRHYRRDGTLFIDETVLDEAGGRFRDEPSIPLRRPDSLIFDLVKTA